MKKNKTKTPANVNILSSADQEVYAAEARKWIGDHYDQRVVESSEINYRLNDEITCSKVVNGSAVVKGILTIWRENNTFQYHFDKR
jgi:hypothetical protein